MLALRLLLHPAHAPGCTSSHLVKHQGVAIVRANPTSQYRAASYIAQHMVAPPSGRLHTRRRLVLHRADGAVLARRAGAHRRSSIVCADDGRGALCTMHHECLRTLLYCNQIMARFTCVHIAMQDIRRGRK